MYYQTFYLIQFTISEPTGSGTPLPKQQQITLGVVSPRHLTTPDVPFSSAFSKQHADKPRCAPPQARGLRKTSQLEGNSHFQFSRFSLAIISKRRFRRKGSEVSFPCWCCALAASAGA